MAVPFNPSLFAGNYAFHPELSAIHPVAYATLRFFAVAAQMEFMENGATDMLWHMREERDSAKRALLHYGMDAGLVDHVEASCRRAGSLKCEDILEELRVELHAAWDSIPMPE
jgi:hypothetical protein